MNSATGEVPAPPPRQLPLPSDDRSVSVLTALEARRTTREIAATPLPAQLLSDLLWAACGVNRRKGPFGGAAAPPLRPATRRRSTSMSRSKRASILYDAPSNLLAPVVAGDLRALAP